jgi:hypothetical protein
MSYSSSSTSGGLEAGALAAALADAPGAGGVLGAG